MSKSMQDVKDMLRNIKVMSERGTENEKKVAKQKLELLLEKHGLTIDDLIKEDVFLYRFKVGDRKGNIFKLFVHIAGHLLDLKESGLWWKNDYACGELTRKQGLFLTLYYNHYRDEYVKEFDKIESTYKKAKRLIEQEYKTNSSNLVYAMVEKHGITPMPENISDNCESMSLEQSILIGNLAKTLTSTDVTPPESMVENGLYLTN